MGNRFAPVVAAVLLAACGSSGGNASTSTSATPLKGTVAVFAAASLTAAFNALGISFQGANSGVTMKFNFAGSPTLVTQIEQGAPADVFASADTTNMDKLAIYITEAPTVPAGKYALQALKLAGVTVTPKSLETDVKSVVGKIELGEADAGIVYTTDVTAAGNKVQGVPIPDADNVIATYPIVAVKATTNSPAANVFIGYVVSAAGQAKLQSFGFLSAS